MCTLLPPDQQDLQQYALLRFVICEAVLKKSNGVLLIVLRSFFC